MVYRNGTYVISLWASNHNPARSDLKYWVCSIASITESIMIIF